MRTLLVLCLLWPWAALSSAFTFDEGLYARPEVRRELDYLRQHAPSLALNRTRAEPWLPHLLPLLRARGLPARLAWLPVVESAWQPGAVSPAGAAGLWQLMPATARRFGILIDNEFDGRLAPLSASRAALAYLAWLHKYFDGDWLLALAAYNAGEGRVRRAIERTGSRDFWTLPLPEETRRYVPRFLAVQKLLGHPEGSASPLTEYRVRGPLSLNALASRLGVSVKALKAQNLALKGEELPADKEVSILLAHAGPPRKERLVPITVQPLFTGPAAGLDLSRTRGLVEETGALFSQETPADWRPY